MLKRTSSLKRTEFKRTGTLHRGPSELKARRRTARRTKPLACRSESTIKQREAIFQAELVASLAHITWCERCGKTGVHLDHAHRVKRWVIWHLPEDEQRAEYMMAVKADRQCHDRWDKGVMPNDATETRNERMLREVTELIARRENQ